MTTVVAVHGAFRGPWAWEPLRTLLVGAGHELLAVDLSTAEDGTYSGDVTMSQWIDRTVVALEHAGALDRDVVLLGHSMGGVVAQGAVAVAGAGVDRLVLLDSPVIEAGQRPVDVSGPTPPDPAMLPDRTTWIPPSPLGVEQGFDDELARWVNERLTPVPMGPQLDAMPTGTGRLDRTTIVFCDRTPVHFPSALARRRCEADGIGYEILDAEHDVALLAPELVLPLLRL